MNREEAHIERRILLALGKMPDVYLARNEVGSGYVGAIRKQLGEMLCGRCLDPAMQLLNRSRIVYGWGVGSPDLMGAVQGRLVGIEVKTPTGRLSDDQERFHAAMRARGLLVGVARSEGEALGLIEEWRMG